MGLCSNDVKSSYIAFHEHFNYIVMHFRCVLYMLSCCVLLGLDWARPMMYFCFACHMFMHFHAYVSSFLYIFIYCCCWYSSDCLSLSLSFWRLFALQHLNANLLRPRTLYVLRHLLPLTLHLLLYGSVMMEPEGTSWRTFVDEAFIWNATLFYQTFLTLTYPLSFTVGVGSHFVTFRSLVPP